MVDAKVGDVKIDHEIETKAIQSNESRVNSWQTPQQTFFDNLKEIYFTSAFEFKNMQRASKRKEPLVDICIA